MGLIDVSRSVFSDMTVWPGDESVILEQTSSISNGSMVNVSRVHMGVHTGTHVDAPLHFIDGGKSVDELDTFLFTGSVLVIDVSDVEKIGSEQLADLPVLNGEAVFFKTAFSEKTLDEPFYTGYTGLARDAALFLIHMGVRVIGTDALSIESYNDTSFLVHKTLLRNEVLVIEGLNLKHVSPGRYKYICMPLFLKGADGAPARVMLIDGGNI